MLEYMTISRFAWDVLSRELYIYKSIILQVRKYESSRSRSRSRSPSRSRSRSRSPKRARRCCYFLMLICSTLSCLLDIHTWYEKIVLFHSAVGLWSDLCLGHDLFPGLGPGPDPDQHHQSSLPGMQNILYLLWFYFLFYCGSTIFRFLNCLSNYRPRSRSRSASPRSPPRQVFKSY
jgi:hypothetical protein